MKKVILIGVGVIILVIFLLRLMPSPPPDEPYQPKAGEVISQSDNTRGVAAKPVETPKPTPRPEPGPTEVVQSQQPQKEVNPSEKPQRQFDMSRLAQVRNREEFLALMKKSGAKYFDSSKGDMNITLNLKPKGE
ncbi:MAG: hypothetical protein Q7R92_01715 [bacterium]|nr:hypothetical protein [bacterium]